MAYIHIDIDIDEFDTDDIIEGLKEKIETRGLKDRDKESLKKLCIQVFGGKLPSPGGNLDERMKWELFFETKNSFTVAELQEKLKK